MDITEARQKVLKLLQLANSTPGSEEARTAAAMACRLIHEHGLMIMTPADLVQMMPPPAPSSGSKASKPRRKRPSAKEVQDTVTNIADTAATAFDAFGRVASAVNGFRNTVRGGT